MYAASASSLMRSAISRAFKLATFRPLVASSQKPCRHINFDSRSCGRAFQTAGSPKRDVSQW